MAKQTIITGNSANDGSGDPARTAFTKVNSNFNELYSKMGNGSSLFSPVQQGGGAGQLANKVFIGWDGSKLMAQVDSTNLGTIQTSVNNDVIFGVGQAAQDFSASRSINTNYINNTDKAIQVAIVGGNLSPGVYFIAYVNNLVIGAFSVQAQTTRASLNFIVPVGSSYRVSLTGGNIITWVEVR